MAMACTHARGLCRLLSKRRRASATGADSLWLRSRRRCSDCGLRVCDVCPAHQHRGLPAHLLLRLAAGEVAALPSGCTSHPPMRAFSLRRLMPGCRLGLAAGLARRERSCAAVEPLSRLHAGCSTSARDPPPSLTPPLQVWFGVEIVLDWMVRSYRKLTAQGEARNCWAMSPSARPACRSGPRPWRPWPATQHLGSLTPMAPKQC